MIDQQPKKVNTRDGAMPCLTRPLRNKKRINTSQHSHVIGISDLTIRIETDVGMRENWVFGC